MTCDDAEEDVEGDDDEVLADDRGGSKMALGLSCHCFVESVTTWEAAGCCFTLFLSGRGGPGEDCDGDDISDDDGVSDEGGLGGATAGLGSDAIMIWSSFVVRVLCSSICDLDIFEHSSICWS